MSCSVSPKIETEVKSLTQGIENQKAIEALTKVQTRIAALEETLKGETLQDAIAMADWNERIAMETLDKLANTLQDSASSYKKLSVTVSGI